MNLLSNFIMTAVVLVSGSVLAAPGNPLSIRELVNQHYQQKELSLFRNSPGRCHPVGRSCADVACDKLGQFGCDEISEIKSVRLACRGNEDGTCMESVCTRLGQFGCDEMIEIQHVARACVGNYDTSCFESTCNRLGQFGCDEISEVEEVLRVCAGN